MSSPLCRTAIFHSPGSSGWNIAVYTPFRSLTGHPKLRPVGEDAMTSTFPLRAPLEFTCINFKTFYLSIGNKIIFSFQIK